MVALGTRTLQGDERGCGRERVAVTQLVPIPVAHGLLACLLGRAGVGAVLRARGLVGAGGWGLGAATRIDDVSEREMMHSIDSVCALINASRWTMLSRKSCPTCPMAETRPAFVMSGSVVRIFGESRPPRGRTSRSNRGPRGHPESIYRARLSLRGRAGSAPVHRKAFATGLGLAWVVTGTSTCHPLPRVIRPGGEPCATKQARPKERPWKLHMSPGASP